MGLVGGSSVWMSGGRGGSGWVIVSKQQVRSGRGVLWSCSESGYRKRCGRYLGEAAERRVGITIVGDGCVRGLCRRRGWEERGGLDG